jgi:adenylate cyclase class 2
MPGDHREIEVKFYVKALSPIASRLSALGAVQIQARLHEYNLRFDTPTGSLERQSKVLRLRRDSAAYLTFKGPGALIDGASQRQEIEFSLDNFDAARAFLQALGYQVSMVYEKYRAVYRLESALVTLDEMPFGHFVEIEGPDSATIQQICTRLGLNWDARIVESYSKLFERVCHSLALSTNNLTFETFAHHVVSSHDLGVNSSDSSYAL